MSEMEYHTGKIKEVVLDMPDSSFEEKVKKLQEMGYNIEEWDEDFIECDNLVYLWKFKKFYELIDHKNMNDYTCEAWKDENDVINFSLAFYNGGTYLGEMLEKSIEEMNKEEENEV
jgi:hypothetical protein